MTTAVDKAKATLLRALDQLEKAEADLEATPERVDLIVVYSIGYEPSEKGAWHEVGGWASTAGPKWLFAALLRRASEGFAGDPVAVDDEPEEDGE